MTTNYMGQYQQYSLNRIVNTDELSFRVVQALDQQEYYQWQINEVFSEEILVEYMQKTFTIYSLLPIVDYFIDQQSIYVYTPYKQTLRMYLQITQMNEFLAFKMIQKLIAVIIELKPQNFNLNLTLDTIFLIETKEEFNLQIFPPYFNVTNQNYMNQLGKLWYYLLKGQEFVNQVLIFPALSIHNNIQLMLMPNAKIEQFAFLIPNQYHFRQKVEFDKQLEIYNQVKLQQDEIEQQSEQYNQFKYKNIYEIRKIKELNNERLQDYFFLTKNLKINIIKRTLLENIQSELQNLIGKNRKVKTKIIDAVRNEQSLISHHQQNINEYQNAVQKIIDKVLQLRDICSQFQVQNTDIERFHDLLIQTKNNSNCFKNIMETQNSYSNIIQQLQQPNQILSKSAELNAQLEQVARNMMELEKDKFRLFLNQKLEEKKSLIDDLQNYDISKERFFLVSKQAEVDALKQQKIQDLSQIDNEIPNADDYSLESDLNRIVQSYLQKLKNLVIPIDQKIKQAQLAKKNLQAIGVYQPKNQSEFQQNLESLQKQFLDPYPFELAMIADQKEPGYKDLIKQKIQQLLNFQQQ